MTDNFNFICMDCGPSEGEPAFTDRRYADYCEKCWQSRTRGCEVCGENDFSPNIEAFEISGQIVCDECADEIFEQNGQFGVGALTRTRSNPSAPASAIRRPSSTTGSASRPTARRPNGGLSADGKQGQGRRGRERKCCLSILWQSWNSARYVIGSSHWYNRLTVRLICSSYLFD
jgi:hypothetical protein